MSHQMHEHELNHRTRVEINDNESLQHWVDTFGVSENELRYVIDTIGDNVKEVEDYLSRKAWE